MTTPTAAPTPAVVRPMPIPPATEVTAVLSRAVTARSLTVQVCPAATVPRATTSPVASVTATDPPMANPPAPAAPTATVTRVTSAMAVISAAAASMSPFTSAMTAPSDRFTAMPAPPAPDAPAPNPTPTAPEMATETPVDRAPTEASDVARSAESESVRTLASMDDRFTATEPARAKLLATAAATPTAVRSASDRASITRLPPDAKVLRVTTISAPRDTPRYSLSPAKFRPAPIPIAAVPAGAAATPPPIATSVAFSRASTIRADPAVVDRLLSVTVTTVAESWMFSATAPAPAPPVVPRVAATAAETEASVLSLRASKRVGPVSVTRTFSISVAVVAPE